MKKTISPVGTSFYSDNIKSVSVGDEVVLKHKPLTVKDREYPNAVAIIHKGKQIGSLKERSKEQAHIVELGESSATVLTLDNIKDTKYEGEWTYTLELDMPEENGWKKIDTFTGETILYNDEIHEYRDLEGNTLLGGSTYAKQFGDTFDAEVMLPRCSKAWGVTEEDIQDIWNMNRDISNGLGTAIHLGLELAHKHAKVGETIKENKKGATENYALPKNVIVRKAVVDFIKEYGTDAQSEVLVSNVKKGRAGQIDRLVVTDAKNKKCRVQDYKTSAVDSKYLDIYHNQLSFYASMLIDDGWTVEGLDILYWDGVKWTKKTLKVLEVKDDNQG